MELKDIELSNGVVLHIINTEKFKTNFIGIFILTDLSREMVTKNALIPAVLKRGTENMPTMKDISTKLEENYGSIFDASSDKIGDRQAIQFYITSINDEYAMEKSELTKSNIKIITDIILNPKLENGIFDKTYVNQEKETLKELINSRINDKSSYAISRCIEEMYKNEPFGLYKYGYVEDLGEITSENLYNQYKNVLSNSEIHIYVSGKINEEEVVETFKEEFEKIERKYEPSDRIIKNIPKEEKQIKEKQDVKQGKLVLAYDVENASLIDEQNKMVLYSAILGGSPSSKLFQNVREKESLAYTVRSTYNKQKALLLISAGIEIEKYETALKKIKEQIEEMKKGEITDNEISDAKIYLTSAYKGFEDEQGSIIDYFMGQNIIKNKESIDETIESINRITKEEIIETANKLNLKMTYFLTNE